MRILNLLMLTLTSTVLLGSSIPVAEPFNAPGNSDVIGDKAKFDAESIQITATGATLTIDIRTNYPNSGLYSYYDTGVRLNPGDIFFTVNGAYQYGIPVAYHNGPAGGPWGERLLAGHVYQIDDPAALMNAREVLHDPMYFDYRPDAIVWMLDVGGVHDVTSGTPVVQVLPIPGNDGVNGPLYDIRVITSLPAGLLSSLTDNYGVSFATTTGGNDIVEGRLNLPAFSAQAAAGPDVPEPSTYYLMIGAALLAIARLAYRRP